MVDLVWVHALNLEEGLAFGCLGPVLGLLLNILEIELIEETPSTDAHTGQHEEDLHNGRRIEPYRDLQRRR